MGSRPTVYPIFGALEDLLLTILRDYFADQPNVHIYERYSEDMELPAIVPLSANRAGMVAYETQQDAWVRAGIIELNTFADGVNRDLIAAQLQEACRHAIYEAHFFQRDYPGVGVLNKVSSSSYARPEGDWATTSHAVQYATLPNGVTRYEARYRLLVRPSKTYTNPFISNSSGVNSGSPENVEE